tara:strand:+ start:12158 stop:12514 length:357 start_codon:yes stop_codon:yes gene_type:complete
MTQGERLARLEAQQEERFRSVFRSLDESAVTCGAVLERVNEIYENTNKMQAQQEERWSKRMSEQEEEHRQLRMAHETDVAALSALTNKGKGVAAVMSVIFVVLGSVATLLFDTFAGRP